MARPSGLKTTRSLWVAVACGGLSLAAAALALLARPSVSPGLGWPLVLAACGSALCTLWLLRLVRREARALAELTALVKQLRETRDLGAGAGSTLSAPGDGEVAVLSRELEALLRMVRDRLTTVRNAAQQLCDAGVALVVDASQHTALAEEQSASASSTLQMAKAVQEGASSSSQEAAAVLTAAGKALDISTFGVETIESTLDGFGDVASHVGEIAQQISELAQRTERMLSIAGTVKDLADSSHLLALNATIQAARAGERGQVFTVVAKEMRRLADQSILAATQVRQILDDIGGAIRTAATNTVDGTSRIDTGLKQLLSGSQHLRELATQVRDNAGAADHVVAVVNLQGVAVGQLLAKLEDHAKLSAHSLATLTQTKDAVDRVQMMTSQLSERLRSLGVD